MPQNKRSKRIKALAMRQNELAQLNSFETSNFCKSTKNLYEHRRQRIEQEINSLKSKIGDIVPQSQKMISVAVVEISA